MKKGNIYHHFKGAEYWFEGIALPKKNASLGCKAASEMVYVQDVRYHEDTHDIKLFSLDGALFINSDLPHVIYQSKKDYGTDRMFAREVDDFFGYKEDGEKGLVKRFTLTKKTIDI